MNALDPIDPREASLALWRFGASLSGARLPTLHAAALEGRDVARFVVERDEAVRRAFQVSALEAELGRKARA